MATTGVKKRSGCLKIAAFVFFVLILVGIANRGQGPEKGPAATETVASEQPSRQSLDFMSVRAAERQVRSLLRDPDSARFSETVVRVRNGARVVCGYVNARNGFGGFTGDTMWIVVEDLKRAVINQSGQEQEFAQLWNKYCAGKG